MRKSLAALTLLAGVLALLLPGVPASGWSQEQASEHPDLALFFAASAPDRGASSDALEQLEKQWRPGYTPMLLEFVRFLSPGAGADTGQLSEGSRMVQQDSGLGDRNRDGQNRFQNRRDPKVQTRERLMEFIKARTGQDFGNDFEAWRNWLWTQPYDPHPGYGALKANLYGNLDPGFRNFFQGNSAIRLDEVDFGGVGVSGIPALDHPPTVAASAASYLADSNIVYGFSINGEHRAYPKRILGWHELAWDSVGGTELTLVYCTLCGTVIPYKSEVGGRVVKFDTSGMLYRSNKLLFDDISNTLWSSLTGEPVVGRMVGMGVRLTPQAVVTTTWGEWRRMHPDTTVLSQDTGFERDYSEGAAYKAYFETDDLMFDVSMRDNRLANKAEVLAMRFATPSGEDKTLAISASYLQNNRVFQTNFSGRDLVVVTSPDGANRVYAASGNRFESVNADGKVVDASGGTWQVGEDALVPDADPSAGLVRLTAFRAFWFGWYAQYPETELIGA